MTTLYRCNTYDPDKCPLHCIHGAPHAKFFDVWDVDDAGNMQEGYCTDDNGADPAMLCYWWDEMNPHACHCIEYGDRFPHGN